MTPHRRTSRAPSGRAAAVDRVSVAPCPSCPRCGCPLDLHQPQPSLPERLLGTCDSCDSWALIEVGPDGAKTITVVLPETTGLLCPSRES
jgi:hypothetical protein